jgi:hypothetical protein
VNLESLDFLTSMSNENSTVLKPEFFSPLSNLKQLKLNWMKISELSEGVFDSLLNLEVLHLSRNKIQC